MVESIAGAGRRVPHTTTYRDEWWRGFLAMIPLWTGVVPFGLTLGLVARQAGFSPVEAQLSSLLIFAGSAQMALIALYEEQAGALTIILTAAVLNLRHVLYGLSLRRLLGNRRPATPVPLLAALLTDESYGVTVAETRRRPVPAGRLDAFLLGASLSLYIVYAAATLAGATLGGLLPEAGKLGLDLVFPLSFLALLVPLLRARRHVLVAMLAAAIALALARFGGGVAVLGATLVGAGIGAWLDGQRVNPA